VEKKKNNQLSLHLLEVTTLRVTNAQNSETLIWATAAPEVPTTDQNPTAPCCVCSTPTLASRKELKTSQATMQAGLFLPQSFLSVWRLLGVI